MNTVKHFLETRPVPPSRCKKMLSAEKARRPEEVTNPSLYRSSSTKGISYHSNDGLPVIGRLGCAEAEIFCSDILCEM